MTEEIIGYNVSFSTFEEFFKRRGYIKKFIAIKYEQDLEYVAIYRMYVGSRPFIKEKYRELIWEYINDYCEEEQMVSQYLAYIVEKKKNRRVKNGEESSDSKRADESEH